MSNQTMNALRMYPGRNDHEKARAYLTATSEGFAALTFDEQFDRANAFLAVARGDARQFAEVAMSSPSLGEGPAYLAEVERLQKREGLTFDQAHQKVAMSRRERIAEDTRVMLSSATPAGADMIRMGQGAMNKQGEIDPPRESANPRQPNTPGTNLDDIEIHIGISQRAYDAIGGRTATEKAVTLLKDKSPGFGSKPWGEQVDIGGKLAASWRERGLVSDGFSRGAAR